MPLCKTPESAGGGYRVVGRSGQRWIVRGGEGRWETVVLHSTDMEGKTSIKVTHQKPSSGHIVGQHVVRKFAGSSFVVLHVFPVHYGVAKRLLWPLTIFELKCIQYGE